MSNQIDVQTLTLDQLKSLAYDELVKLEIARENIKVLQGRIQQLQSEPVQKENGHGDNNDSKRPVTPVVATGPLATRTP